MKHIIVCRKEFKWFNLKSENVLLIFISESMIVHDLYDPSVIPLFTHPDIYGTVVLDVLPVTSLHTTV